MSERSYHGATSRSVYAPDDVDDDDDDDDNNIHSHNPNPNHCGNNEGCGGVRSLTALPATGVPD